MGASPSLLPEERGRMGASCRLWEHWTVAPRHPYGGAPGGLAPRGVWRRSHAVGWGGRGAALCCPCAFPRLLSAPSLLPLSPGHNPANQTLAVFCSWCPGPEGDLGEQAIRSGKIPGVPSSLVGLRPVPPACIFPYTQPKVSSCLNIFF